jgi:hypothetical protein
MKISLETDFRDYYDHIFYPGADASYRRMAHAGDMPKRRQIDIMRKLHLPRLPFLPCQQQRSVKTVPLVVYTDPAAHCGEGKLLVEWRHAIEAHPLDYSIPFIATTNDPHKATSYRLLQVGNRAWWLRYEGHGGWMSNHCERTEICVIEEITPIDRTAACIKEFPIFAIDFVVPVAEAPVFEFGEVLEHGYAIDFNSAPGLRGTGMEDILSATEVYGLVAETLRNWEPEELEPEERSQPPRGETENRKRLPDQNFLARPQSGGPIAEFHRTYEQVDFEFLEERSQYVPGSASALLPIMTEGL